MILLKIFEGFKENIKQNKNKGFFCESFKKNINQKR